MRDVNKIKQEEIAIIAGASCAIKEFANSALPDEEAIMARVFKEVSSDKHLRPCVIAGANFALKKKQRNLKISEREIMEALSREIPLMVRELKEDQ